MPSADARVPPADAAGPVDAQNAPTRSLENSRLFSTATTGLIIYVPTDNSRHDFVITNFRPTDSAEEAVFFRREQHLETALARGRLARKVHALAKEVFRQRPDP